MPRPKPIRFLAAAALALGAAMPAARPAWAQPQNIIINQLDDVAFGTWSGIGNLVQIMNFCVGRQGGAHRFRLTAVGPGAGGAFSLTNGISQLPFALEIRDNSGTWFPLTANVAQPLLTGANHNQCISLSVEGLSLRVTLQQANLGAATGGFYSGIVRLTVAPD